MDSILEEEEEEDEEEEDTEFPSEILFRFLLGTLLSFSAGERGEMRCLCPVSVAEGCAAPRAWGRLLQLPPLLLLSVPAATAVLRLGTWASLLPPGTELPTVLRHPQNG